MTHRQRYKKFSAVLLATLIATFILSSCEKIPQVALTESIDREAVVTRHNPALTRLDPWSAFTLGNGSFAFTADVTGLQSLADQYYAQGIPLETKARWAWHSRANPNNFTLADTYETYTAYGRETAFPTNMNNDAAQWLRQNPHDLPLARISFTLNGEALGIAPSNIEQELDMWNGILHSNFELQGETVQVLTIVDSEQDKIAAHIESDLLTEQILTVDIHFPRGYLLDKKNTPDVDFNNPREHSTKIIYRPDDGVIFQRSVDNAEYLAFVQWQGKADLRKIDDHHYRLRSKDSDELTFSLRFSKELPKTDKLNFDLLKQNVSEAWQTFWQNGAFVDFSESSHPQAQELERRIISSRYLLAAQARANIPPQESGLTHSSWYGKHHSEMSWWHSAHWTLWGQAYETEKLLKWYKAQLPSAKALAKERGLQGARWAKMVGPDNRESPGGNPLIIWNQPQLIHLAEMVYQSNKSQFVLNEYADVVEESARAMASMLQWDANTKQYNLDTPIWIAQEIYDPRLSKNPGFELAYWREGLELALLWRKRTGKKPIQEWQLMIDKLAPLPVKDGKYVAIESIPDTFENPASRQDHPSMLAAFGLLNDPRINKTFMRNTLQAVLDTWDWENKIWGWDYPMVAMTAARLGETQIAVDTLLADKTHNNYLLNGHVPQPGSELRVYLPANSALLAAVAMMIAGWEGAPERAFPGFPDDDSWSIKAEGFTAFQ